MPDTPVPVLDLRKLGFDPEQMGGSLLVVSGRVGKVGNYQPEKGGPEYARADIAMYGTTAKVKFPDDRDPTYQKLLNLPFGSPVVVLQPCTFDQKSGSYKALEESTDGRTCQLLETGKAAS